MLVHRDQTAQGAQQGEVGVGSKRRERTRAKTRTGAQQRTRQRANDETDGLSQRPKGNRAVSWPLAA